jgi:LysM repeat protein
MKTKKVVRMPLRPTPAKGRSRTAKPLRARAATINEADEDDYEDGEEPNMRFSHALIVVLVLHLVAVGGVFAFNWMKARQADKVGGTALVESTDRAEPAPPAVTARSAAPATSAQGPQGATWDKRTHTVAAGDTLTRVASSYGVTIAAIESVNGIDDYSMIRVGQVLKIPDAAKPSAPAATAKSTKELSTTTAPTSAQHAFLATRDKVTTKKAVIAAVATRSVVPAAPASVASAKTQGATGDLVDGVYVVVKGDNPYSIAKKLSVSYNELIKINEIADPTKIQIGQKLKIPR